MKNLFVSSLYFLFVFGFQVIFSYFVQCLVDCCKMWFCLGYAKNFLFQKKIEKINQNLKVFLLYLVKFNQNSDRPDHLWYSWYNNIMDFLFPIYYELLSSKILLNHRINFQMKVNHFHAFPFFRNVIRIVFIIMNVRKKIF